MVYRTPMIFRAQSPGYRVDSLKTIGFVKKTSKYGKMLKLNRLHSPHYSKIRDKNLNLG